MNAPANMSLVVLLKVSQPARSCVSGNDTSPASSTRTSSAPRRSGVTGLAHECPDTNRLSFERTAGPPLPNTIGTHGLIRACPHPSGPSLVCQHPPKTTLDKHRSFVRERFG